MIRSETWSGGKVEEELNRNDGVKAKAPSSLLPTAEQRMIGVAMEMERRALPAVLANSQKQGVG